jgi:hypothetical protein
MKADGRSLELAVVCPLEDARGDIVEHLQTWLRDQGLPRDRYQLVVAGSGDHPDVERDVAAILAPHDSFVAAPGASLVELYAAAADAASAPVILLTEAHITARPGCLAPVVAAFAADPKLAAATLNFHNRCNSPMAELVERWVTQALDDWHRGGWIRFNATAVAIRADALSRAGGIDARLDVWAFQTLSARLHAQGERVARLEGDFLDHTLEDAISDQLWFARHWTEGECVLRAEDPEFCERYFGPAGLWDRRLVYRPEVARSMLSALTAAIRHDPRHAGWLTRELVARLPAGVAGARPRLAWERSSAAWNGALASAKVLPRKLRWRNFVAAQEGTVAAARLRQGAKLNGLPDPVAESKVAAERLEGVLIGDHGFEQNGDRRFRWTEPVALLRLAPSGDSVLRMDTAGLRGHPLDSLHGVYVDGEQLPGELVTGDAETLEVQLPARLADAVASSGVVFICRPLVPSREGSSDSRRLGIPIAEVELKSA